MKQWFTTFGTSKSHGLHKSIPKKSKILDTVIYCYCFLESRWLLHDSKKLDISCCKPVFLNCCSTALHFHSYLYGQSESSTDGEEALQSCHPQRLNPHHIRHKNHLRHSLAGFKCFCSCFWNVWTIHVTVKIQNKGSSLWVRTRKRFHTLCPKHCKTNQNDKAPQQKM